MGSPDFAVPSLEALVDARHEVVAAYCQPPRPAGRGKAERKTAVHERAEQLRIEVRTPRTLRDEEEQARFRALFEQQFAQGRGFAKSMLARSVDSRTPSD